MEKRLDVKGRMIAWVASKDEVDEYFEWIDDHIDNAPEGSDGCIEFWYRDKGVSLYVLLLELRADERRYSSPVPARWYPNSVD